MPKVPEIPFPPAEEAAAVQSPPSPASCRSLQGKPFISPDRSFNSLRTNLARRRWRKQTGNLPTSELCKLLATLEKELATQASGRSQGGLLRIRLRQELRQRKGLQTSLLPEDQDTLDLVLLVFDQLWQRYMLSAPIQDALGRLQIPLVRLALVDKAFFDAHDHPAKKLFDHLVTSTFGEPMADFQARSPLADAIEKAVQTVLQANRRDLVFYEHLDQTFLRWLADYRQTLVQWEDQMHQKIHAQDAQREAQHAVAQLLRTRLAGCSSLPEGIALLIQMGWKQVLRAAYRSGGPSGEPWRQAVAVLDRLLWSIQPKSDAAERHALVQAIPELLRDLRQGLQALPLESRWVSARFRELQAAHLHALQAQPQFSIREAGESVMGEPSPLALKRLDFPCEDFGLTPGIWLEFYARGNWYRRKFLGYAEGETLVFADGAARNKQVWTFSTLMHYFTSARVRVLGKEDSPILDSLLEDLAWTLEMA